MASAAIWSNVVLPNQALLRETNDHRSCMQQGIDKVTSIVRQFQYWVSFFVRRKSCDYAHQIGQNRQWSPENQGLCVLLHGLRSHPAAWHPQVSLLRKESGVEVLVPCVPRKGMCSLEEAAQPILPIILDYARKNPQKAIFIGGISNGSRLATWLETQLRKEAPSTPVKVSTIAGIHFGSSRMQLLEWLGIASCFYPRSLRDELHFGSQKAKELLQAVLAPLPERVAPRDYEFYATTADLSVPDLGSSLPRLNKGEKIHILHGHSHDSIVAAVANQQIASCLQWMRTPR